MRLLFFLPLFIILQFSLHCGEQKPETRVTKMETKIHKYIATPKGIEKLLTLSEVDKAIAETRFREAYDLLFAAYSKLGPEDQHSRSGRYLLIRMAHIHIYSEMWEPALEYLSEAIMCPDSVGNPLLHLRIGQAAVHLKEGRIRDDNLARALITGGFDVFEGEESELREIPLKLLKPPVNSSWQDYPGQDWNSTK